MTGYPSQPVAALFLAPLADRSAALCEALAGVALSGTVRIGHRIGGALPKFDPDSGHPLPLLACPFAAIAVACGPTHTAVHALRSLLQNVAADIEFAASALVLGTEYSVKPGDGAVLVAMLVRRRADYGAAAFRERWLGGHAQFGLRIPVSGYRQWHAGEGTFPDLPAADRFDGAGIVLFGDADQVAASRADPAIAHDATRDEMQFIDHAGSMLAMFRFSD